MKTKPYTGLNGVLAALLLLTQSPALFAQSEPTPTPPPSDLAALQKIEPQLLESIQSLPKSEQRPFLVVLSDTVDLRNTGPATWNARGEFVYQKLRSTAEKSQARLRRYLSQRGVEFKPFWIMNAMSVTATTDVMLDLARQPEVSQIHAERIYHVPDQINAIGNAPVNGVEWNIDRIGARTAWNNYGTRGEGIVVCNIDTGVQYTHPALFPSYRGNTEGGLDHNYNWFGPPGVLFPMDQNGHGTHTMGTMVGDGGEGNRIGVAPGARWIAAQGFIGANATSWNLLGCAQWVLAPTDLAGQNPRPDLRPDIVNNSWGGELVGDETYRAVVQQWIAAGIFPTFSAGNLGSAEYGAYCSTVFSPGDYPESYTVTAFDLSDHLANFASTGPALAFGISKPNIAAPGLAIKSSYPGDRYAISSGTSMASPHVAGAVALLWSAAPSIKGDIAATRALLDQAAINSMDLSCGGTGTNNNMWGEGRLDIAMALSVAPRGPSGFFQGGVTNADSSEPVAGATVTAVGPMTRTVVTDSNGVYTLGPLVVGTYEISVRAQAYLSQTNPAVNIDPDAPVALDFSLEQTTASFSLAGTVYDALGSTVSGAQVKLVGLTNAPAVSGAQGAYAFTDIPEGTYEMLVDGGPCLIPASQVIELSADITGFNLTLEKRYDAFGYGCEVIAPAFVRASTPLMLSGDDFTTNVALPFAFPFYGKTYRNVYVSGNGALVFDPVLAGAFDNFPVPTPFEPNAAIYAFWDDMYLGSSNHVYSLVRGIAPNREFIIEWRTLYQYASQFTGGKMQALDVEVIMRENGEILVQYANVPDSPGLRGASATFGIENEDGTVGFNLASGTPILKSPSYAVRYRHAPMTLVRGQVRDANDRRPIPRATIRVTQPGGIREFTTDESGVYSVYVLTNGCTIEASAFNYAPVSINLELPVKSTAYIQDFVLPTAHHELLPGSLRFVLATNQIQTLTLTLTNSGTSDLNWSFGPRGAYKITEIVEPVLNPLSSPDAPNTRNLYLEPAVTAFPAVPGDVLASWAVTNVGLGWGIVRSTNGNLWISDANAMTNSTRTNINVPNNWEFTTAGVQTGAKNKVLPPGAWGADMAYDSKHGLICQVMVGGPALTYTSSIVCWNPATGAVVTNIGGVWGGAPQKGLAYRPDTDTFYIGGWPTSIEHSNSGVILQVKGLSYQKPGEIVTRPDGSPSIIRPSDTSIAGLAWDPDRKILWQACNSFKDNIYALDPDTGNILFTLAHPNPGYNSAGIETDELGRLWVVGQSPNIIYLLNTGVDVSQPIPWLTSSVTSGTIPAGATQTVDLTVDSTGFEIGEYAAQLLLQTDGGKSNIGYVSISTRTLKGETLFSPPAPGTASFVPSGWYGMRFEVGPNPVWVIGLGRVVAPENRMDHPVKLVNAATGEDVPGGEAIVTTSGKNAGAFSYAYLQSPVALQANATYYLVSQESWGEDQMYPVDSQNPPPHSSVVQTGSVHPAYLDSSAQWNVDELVNSCYGPLSFIFVAPRSLTVSAIDAQPDLVVGVSPADTGGRGDLLVGQSRAYSGGTEVMLTAPPLSGDKVFQYWSEDSNLLSSNRVTTVTLTQNRAVTAVYGYPVLEGVVRTALGRSISNVTITISGGKNVSFTTLTNGSFATNVSGGLDYQVMPQLSNEAPAQRGVTTLDIFFTQRHVLGLEKFNSPLKMLAADVDRNDSVDSLDIFYMRRFVLAFDRTFPAGLWRFMPANYFFPDPSVPWATPAALHHAMLQSNGTFDDFIGLKLGDVDLSWPATAAPSPTKAKALMQPYEEVVRLVIPEIAAMPGETVMVPVVAQSFQDVSVLQFSLEWDPDLLNLQSVSDFGLPGLSRENFGTSRASGLTFSWDAGAEPGAELSAGTFVFQMSFKVAQSPGRSSALMFTEVPTPPLATRGSHLVSLQTESGAVLIRERTPPVVADLNFRDPETLEIVIPTEQGVSYVLEAADSLTNPEWKRLASFTGTGLNQIVRQEKTSSVQRFYRVRFE